MSDLATPCREWQGSRNAKGYGRVWRADSPAGRYPLAHRLVWALMNGPIPEGMEVCHHCDNPPCFRLDHLFLGTHAENMQDSARKGRRYDRESIKTHCPQGHEYTPENTKRKPNGWRECRICANTHLRVWRAKRKAARG